MKTLNHQHPVKSNTFIGQSKTTIIKTLQAQGDDYVEFLRWLFIPKSQSVLSFDKHICQRLDHY